MAEKSEKDLLLYHLDRKIKKAIESYRLIENGDRILIGLSGGKDSIALVELLGKRMKIFSPPIYGNSRPHTYEKYFI